MSFKKMPTTQVQSVVRLIDFTGGIKQHKFNSEEAIYQDRKCTQKVQVTFELQRQLSAGRAARDVDILVIPRLEKLEEITPEVIQELLTHNSQHVRTIASFIQQLLPEDDEPPF